MEPAESKVQDVLLEEEMKSSYLNYAMSVIIARALPDVRDGLKPSQRRILVAMNDLSLAPNAKYRKCAKICGDTSGNYHPHGEAVVYPTLVRLAQDFSTRYPLVDGQGNFGTIDPDPPAAMRYTEARLRAVAMDLLEDLDKETVDFVPNYDESRQEPSVLPAKFPNLLVNGAQGIAVGMSTSIAPHNLREVAAALRLLIANPACSSDDLLEVMPGPDFPTGGMIMGRAGIREAYRTGRGRVVIRARSHVESGKKTTLVFTEVPYGVTKKSIYDKIIELVKTERITGIADVNDQSARGKTRIVVDLKRDAEEEVVLNQLYKMTPLQDTFPLIHIALVNNRPETLSLKELLVHYRDNRVEIIRRRTRFLLREAEKRAHILEALLKALGHIDRIIKIIRGAQSPPAARASLMEAFAFTDVQAQAILDMRLARLTGLEREKLQKEYDEVMASIRYYRELLASEKMVMDLVRKDLDEMVAKYGDERRTEIVDAEADINLEDIIADESVAITVSHSGYIKRVPLTTYRAQGRGTQGKTGAATREDDFIEDLFVASTKDYILFFTDRGRVYWLKVYEIPDLGRTSRGRAIVNLLDIPKGVNVTAHIPVRLFDDRYVFMVTEQGTVKKTPLVAFSHPQKGGIRAITLDPGDQLIVVQITSGEDDVVLGTAQGMAIRFNEKDVRPMGRPAQGVRGIRLIEGDKVVGMARANRSGTLLTVCEHGHGKRTTYDEYRMIRRGGQGVINIRTTERNGKVVSVLNVNEGDHLMMITREGVVNRVEVTEESIRPIGRATQGVRFIRLREGDALVSVARVLKVVSDKC
ncbi:MAG: DNA gyrase subunit A [Planctomycetes bacterium]|nr:DNA gyrase subunit A [Planctomycetota bacterium]